MATWSFAGFDWVRFRAIAPDLRRAVSVRDLRTSVNTQIAEVAGAFDDTASTAEVCNVVITEVCTRGRWVFVRPSLPELIRDLRRRDPGEDAADMITDLALSAHNIESWFKVDSGIMGLATRAEVDHLASHLAAYDRDAPRTGDHRAGIAGWARRFAPTGGQGDVVAELAELVREARQDELGLAAILED